MTDCLRCHVPLDDRADLVGALQHVACPTDDYITDVALFVIADALVRPGIPTLTAAIADALAHIDREARHYDVDPAKLRAAIEAEGMRRNVA